MWYPPRRKHSPYLVAAGRIEIYVIGYGGGGVGGLLARRGAVENVIGV